MYHLQLWKFVKLRSVILFWVDQPSSTWHMVTRECCPSLGVHTFFMERVGRVVLGSLLVFTSRGKGRVWLVFCAFDIEQINSLIMCSTGEKCMPKKTGMCKEAVCVASGIHGWLLCKNIPRFLWPYTLVKHSQIVRCQLSTVCAGANDIFHKLMKADVFTAP